MLMQEELDNLQVRLEEYRRLEEDKDSMMRVILRVENFLDVWPLMDA